MHICTKKLFVGLIALSFVVLVGKLFTKDPTFHSIDYFNGRYFTHQQKQRLDGSSSDENEAADVANSKYSCSHVDLGAFHSSVCDIRDAMIEASSSTFVLFRDVINASSGISHSIAGSNQVLKIGSFPHYESWKGDGRATSISVRFSDQSSETACADWIEDPVLVLYHPYPLNYWHSFADLFLTAFGTLIDAGLWSESKQSLSPVYISVQPFAVFPSAYYENLVGKAVPKQRAELENFIRHGANAVDPFNLLRLLTPFPIIFDHNFDSKPAATSHSQWSVPPLGTCFRRILVGGSKTLDANTDYVQHVIKRSSLDTSINIAAFAFSPTNTDSQLHPEFRGQAMGRLSGFLRRQWTRLQRINQTTEVGESEFNDHVDAIWPPKVPLLTIIDRSKQAFGGRRLANVPEIQQWAEDMGLLVKVLDFGKTPKLESVNLLRQSTILFGLHGAGFSNVAFMRPGSVCIMLQPTQTFQYFPGFFVNVAKFVGAGFIWKDIPCCDKKETAYSMPKVDFENLVRVALQQGVHSGMYANQKK